jgi:hypothetical protein
MKRFIPIIFSVLAVVFGVIFIISGIHTLSEKDLYDSTVTATIVDVEEHWEDNGEDSSLVTTYFIDYEIDGVKYEHVESPVQSSNLGVGDTVDILYQSKNPEKISSQNITAGATIFIVVGSLVAIGGCISTVRAVIRFR